MKYYISVQRGGAAVYGRITRSWFVKGYDNLGVKTPDMHNDCVKAAYDAIRKWDPRATVEISYPETPYL